TSATACAAEAWLCGVSMTTQPCRSMPCCSATARMRRSGPTRVGTMRPRSRASRAPCRDTSSQGWTMAVGRPLPLAAGAIMASSRCACVRINSFPWPACVDCRIMANILGGRAASLAALDQAMLSYRHAFHAGNHADDLKHTELQHSIKPFDAKVKDTWVADTHDDTG